MQLVIVNNYKGDTMGLFDIFKRNKKADKAEELFTPPEFYSEKDSEIIDEAIAKYFGKFNNVFHEIISDTIHIDIAIIEPNENKDYYTLATFGVGAKKMNFHDAYNRMELMIHLPKNWNVESNEEKWYWPIRLLKTLGRFPFAENTWLGQGHTIQYQEGFIEGTDFAGIILDRALAMDGEYPQIHTEKGEQVHFLQVIPIYKTEMEYKINSEKAEDLLVLLPKVGYDYLVDVNRKNVIATND